jgi:SAM-dependent methyltransferase
VGGDESVQGLASTGAPRAAADSVDADHRDFVGPASHFDLSGGLQFGLLVVLGMREHHKLLDIGCGSLRGGKLFIPYLSAGGYHGLEPATWLVEEGIARELSPDLVARKQPCFRDEDDFALSAFGRRFDFLLAQSIFSHAAPAQVRRCLAEARAVLEPQGVFAATFFAGKRSYTGSEWVYPGIVKYRTADLVELAREADLDACRLDWPHADGQSWMAFTRRGARKDLRRIAGRGISGASLLRQCRESLEQLRRSRRARP